jgi:uncharacterized SAM-binding protein YcdF (DUF218 family)
MRRILLGVLVAVLAYFALTTALVTAWMGRDQHPRVDAVVVLGAAQYNGQPSPIYRARLEHALDLYSSGAAPMLVFTGGNEPGDRFTEGGSGAQWALAHGVPESAILTEETSRTTYGNLAGARQLLQDKIAPRQRARIIIVSDPFHMFRAVKQAQDLGMTAYPSPTRTSPTSASKVRLSEAVLREDIAIGSYMIAGSGR